MSICHKDDHRALGYSLFKEWKQSVERESGLQLVALRADNGGEFNRLEEKIIKQDGIKIEFTIAYTPEQSESLNAEQDYIHVRKRHAFETGLSDKF